MGIYYAKGTRDRVIQQLQVLSKDDLWDLVDLLEIPTNDRPPDHDWEHKELRQRITDWIYLEDFEAEKT